MQPSTKKALGVSAAVLGGLFVIYLILKTPKKKSGETAIASPTKGVAVPGTGTGTDVFGDSGQVGTGSNIDPPPVTPSQAQSTNTAQALVISGQLTPPPTDPHQRPGFNPLMPKTAPTAGYYYRVKKGDTLIGIMRSAGNPGSAWPKLVDHPLNEWIPRYKNVQYYGSRDGLPLFQRFNPPGWKTRYLSYQRSDSVFPIIYIPTQEESRS